MSSTLAFSSQSKPAFSVRIFVCDHYSTKPVPGVDVIYSEFRGSDIKQVPVLRIFGSAPDGHKACLHVHGVFPYFYVPCPDPNPQPQFLYQMAASLDKALNIALKQATSANQHVYKISLVKGLPFYGFHDKDHLFLKIFLYNPGLIKQAVDLCANGAILGQPFQPYEAHLNFTLQFFIDFNLFGMSNVDLQSVSFRKKPGNSQNSNDPLDSLEDSLLKSESMCYYEADCTASHIINRQRVDKGDGIENPGLKEIWQQEEERRKKLNMSIASKSLSQGRIKAEQTDSHYKFDQIFKIKMSNLVNKPVAFNSKDINIDISYPAVSLDESDVFKAVDVSMHLPDKTLGASMNETLTTHNETQDLDDTLVDESIALNSSLSMHYSQIQLDSEDLDLLDVLKDMDEKAVEEDSVMGTPAAAEDLNDNDSDDAEYSQVFNDDTILVEPFTSKNDDLDESSPIWNDSFWDDANIPQMDGTCDDDHVKKVRKRKMRPFKLGLSRPKNKRKVTVSTSEATSNAVQSESDEINASRETIDSISSLHLKKAFKNEPKSVLETVELDQDSQFSNDSISDLVNKVTNKYESVKTNTSKAYDLKNNYESIAGPSKCNAEKTEYNSDCDKIESCNKSLESSPDDLGFISFYNTSKLFDVSLDDKSPLVKLENEEDEIVLIDRKENYVESTLLSEEDIKLHYSNTPLVSNLKSLNIKHESHVAIENVDQIVLTPKFRPPTRKYIESTIEKYKIPKVRNLEPYYSNHKDVGDKVEIGQMIIKVQSKLSHDQKPLDNVLDTTSIEEWRQLMFFQNNLSDDENTKPNSLKTLLAGNRQCVLEPIKRPPTSKEIIEWLKAKDSKQDLVPYDPNTTAQKEVTNMRDDLETSQVIGLNELETSISLESVEKDKTCINESLQITMQPDGSFLCFGSGQQHQQENEVTEAATVEVNHITIMLVEVHTATRGELNPDPLFDEIEAVFITITNDSATEHFPQKTLTKIIVVDDMTPPKKLDRCVFNQDISYVNSEKEIIERVLELIKLHDPDIMCGYEIEMGSWGYILDRAEHLGWEIVQEISRINEKHRQKRWRGEQNDYESRVIGRVLFNVWRLFRHELALSSYSFESCMYEVLKERVPQYSHAQLSQWWRDESRVLRWVPVEHYLTRLSGTVRMLEKLDIINRTAELARLFGLQWREVLTRGSQLRVESLMLRAARPLNLLPLSPTVRQRAAMTAPDCLPLIFEPQSRFYADPVIVLDFKSLYPSIMIAYNYCFSTCIGRVHNINGDAPYEFGAWRLRISKAKLAALSSSDLIHWSPVGVGFVKQGVRRGVLPALLTRVLSARQAVNSNMKRYTDPQLKKAAHSRQLGLKLIANVTYGYTAANFSGRMPCVEVGDSVVAKGRETLEHAIQLVNNGGWNAKVVYGDTDSMFVVVPGGSRADAWRIGREIADAVTADNPSPVALKLEKVYQPCILQTKKRYVGYMFESPEQAAPSYEAKGIETVRRDGCPAGVALLRSSLCTLFDTGDLSLVKSGAVRVLSRLAAAALPAPQLFFTREYRGPAGYKAGGAAPPMEIANRLLSRDRRAAPRVGERVTWLVTSGAPGLPLVKLARTPEELRKDPSLRPHIAYYATRVLLPPLHRCLSLLGVNVFKWWSEVGYGREAQMSVAPTGGISRYLGRWRCALCGARSQFSLCGGCASRPQRPVVALHARLNRASAHAHHCAQVCASCCGHSASAECVNTACPALWRRLAAQHQWTQAQDTVREMPPHLVACEALHF